MKQDNECSIIEQAERDADMGREVLQAEFYGRLVRDTDRYIEQATENLLQYLALTKGGAGSESLETVCVNARVAAIRILELRDRIKQTPHDWIRAEKELRSQRDAEEESRHAWEP